MSLTINSIPDRFVANTPTKFLRITSASGKVTGNFSYFKIIAPPTYPDNTTDITFLDGDGINLSADSHLAGDQIWGSFASLKILSGTIYAYFG